MQDITMCQNKTCPVAYKCYRMQADPSEYQYYSVFTYDDKDGCEFFYRMFNQVDDEQELSSTGEA